MSREADRPGSPQFTIRRCLFCRHAFEEKSEPGADEVKQRVAYDPERGRIWTICGLCHSWNLWPLDRRLGWLARLEHLASVRAHLLHQTENIALLDAGEFELVRVGRAALPEKAWWRYGRELRRRRRWNSRRLSRVGAVTYGAMSYLGSGLGLNKITGQIDWESEPIVEIIRWRLFGRTAWSGRAPCPRCRSVLLKLFFQKSGSVLLLPDEGNRVAVGFPCSRCDPWTLEKVHRFAGPAGERVLRRVLAYKNIMGATEAALDDALAVIEEAGSAGAYIKRLASQSVAIYDLEPAGSIALEIAVNENAERKQLALELAGIQARWRYEEELAAIIDEELTLIRPSAVEEERTVDY